MSTNKFISETELEEQRKKRQEEWEKVRKPEDPLERPQEPYDPRPLYDRLKEQRDKKEAEYEEAHRLKNLMKGLDDDEVAFLELVDKTKIDLEAQRQQEEMHELQEYRKAVSSLAIESSDLKLQELKKSVLPIGGAPAKKSQREFLTSAVKRKKSESSESESSVEKKVKTDNAPVSDGTDSAPNDGGSQEYTGRLTTAAVYPSAVKCIGVLPGLGVYTDSSSDEFSSSDPEDNDINFDLGATRSQVQFKKCSSKTQSC